ncbi:LacI family DNA-binding transcriptional regulator [Actinoplanes rectilineatus]|uniref:LacI family DNA-binding transcriptional regulator n=1 Tax=Actinoplanes rectilineatus TaxID=113571 RepID=UPI0005F2E900|nr:LacI family DNA-binding transcriptional regulator [Actinoplanes rectilineatus]
MRDVAQASGVSAATVSFVLNDKAGQTIPEATRERVRRAAADLGYVPHSIARALREGNSRIVVLEAGGLPRGNSLDGFITGLDDELAAAGFGLLVSYSDGPSSRAAVAAVSPRAVIDLQGVYRSPDREVADGGWIDGMAAHTTTQISHLIERGHSRVAIAVPASLDPFFALMAGHIRNAAVAAGLPSPPFLVADSPLVGDRLHALREDGFTAIAAVWDDLALAVLAAMTDLGWHAPADLAVIGFDDTAHGALWRPALTSVRIDARSYGRRMARTVLDLPVGDASPAPAEIVRRAST